MLRKLKEKWNNSGNTFVIVLVTIATMGILIAVILATVGYYYQSRMTDLENKNNFYYVEKAMDDIYSGIGSDSVSKLMYAYEETVQVLVYYDTSSGRYVTIDETSANVIMKQKFLSEMALDASYSSQAQLYEHLKSFITVSDVELVDPATLDATQPRLYLEVVTSTEGEGASAKTVYDKLVIHNVTVKRTTAEGYVQSITTDIEITEPEFDVAFSSVDSMNNAIYDFSMIADMGIEFNDATNNLQNITISGNVYAASDYYNKEYNESASTRVSNYYDGSAESAAKLALCNGLAEQSRYSGIYVNSTSVSIMADTIIVPGSISVIDDANLYISGNVSNNVSSTAKYADVWADNIVIAPSYTRTVSKKMNEGQFTMYANAYIADDLEINGDDASVELAGNYYGYNYSQSSETERVLSQYVQSDKAHYNSSAIIINGDNAYVDMTGLTNLYVAGRAYISTTTTRDVTVDYENNTATTYYVNAEENKTNVDVQTGESISVKSSQLAYMPLGVMDYNGISIPKFTSTYEAFNETIYEHIKDWLDPDNPVVSQTVSGNTYYFLKFANAESASAFFDWYVNDLPDIAGYDIATDLVDVTSYADMDVSDIKIGDATVVTTSGSYTSGAMNVAASKSLTVNASSTYSSLLVDVDGSANNVTSVALIQKASQYNSDYLEMKYALQLVDPDAYTGDDKDEAQALKDAIAAMSSENVTPLNYYLDMSKVSDSAYTSGVKIGNSYVWISTGDVTVTAPTGSNGKVLGLVIAEGDVTFDDDVTKFEGLIISGSKIIVDHKVDFVANAEIVKTILRTAEASEGSSDDYSGICKIFKMYESSSTGSSSGNTSVGNIEIGDVLQYSNWKKNVE